MSIGVRFAIGLAVLSCFSVLTCASASALNYGVSPEVLCGMEVTSNEVVERATKLLSPAEGATVIVGEPVIFTGESGVESPLRFAVASSPALLVTPDIDGGMGVVQTGDTYTFTSTKTTTVPRTIYWDASFTRTLKGCEGPPVTFTTPPQTLIVATSLISPPTAPPPPPHLTVSISNQHTSAMTRNHSRGPKIVYKVNCSLDCTGSTTGTAWILRRHHRPVPAPKLDLPPRSLDIRPVSGGSQQLVYHYHGSALHQLQVLLRAGEKLELRLNAQAGNPKTGVVLAPQQTTTI